MKRYRVILSPRAFRQLGEMERWIEEEADPATARRYRKAIVAHCFQLQTFPDRGRSRDDLRPGLQTLVHKRRVTIAYATEGETVVIVALVGRGREIAPALDD